MIQYIIHFCLLGEDEEGRIYEDLTEHNKEERRTVSAAKEI